MRDSRLKVEGSVELSVLLDSRNAVRLVRLPIVLGIEPVRPMDLKSSF